MTIFKILYVWKWGFNLSLGTREIYFSISNHKDWVYEKS